MDTPREAPPSSKPKTMCIKQLSQAIPARSIRGSKKSAVGKLKIMDILDFGDHLPTFITDVVAGYADGSSTEFKTKNYVYKTTFPCNTNRPTQCRPASRAIRLTHPLEAYLLYIAVLGAIGPQISFHHQK